MYEARFDNVRGKRTQSHAIFIKLAFDPYPKPREHREMDRPMPFPLAQSALAAHSGVNEKTTFRGPFMPIDHAHVMSLTSIDQEFTYSERDTMLYALGIGMGGDPINKAELAFVYENGLKTIPTMATVIAWGAGRLGDSGINYSMVVHGEQRVTLHKPLPPSATILAARLQRVPVVLDGYMVTAAAALLHAINPRALDHCIVGHVSEEPGHRALLDRIGKKPVLDLGLRLGEGTGAALAVLIIKAAVACHAGMATFGEAGVAGPE
jgi:Phosphoribosyltransferase